MINNIQKPICGICTGNLLCGDNFSILQCRIRLDDAKTDIGAANINTQEVSRLLYNVTPVTSVNSTFINLQASSNSIPGLNKPLVPTTKARAPAS